MNWEALAQGTSELFERFSHKATIGTFDATIIASARLAGAEEILSFGERLKGLGAALQLNVFPKLGSVGKSLASELRRS